VQLPLVVFPAPSLCRRRERWRGPES